MAILILTLISMYGVRQMRKHRARVRYRGLASRRTGAEKSSSGYGYGYHFSPSASRDRRERAASRRRQARVTALQTL